MRTLTRALAALVVLGALGIVRAAGEGTVFRLIVVDGDQRTKRGSGFVVEGRDHIITAYHVVQGARRIAVDRPENAQELEVVGVSPEWDVALLKLPPSLANKTVRWRVASSGKASTPAAEAPVAIFGYGSVLDQLQRYTGKQENLPFVLSEKWMRPDFIRTESRTPRLFSMSGIRLLMLQVPLPYGVSGGPVTDASGDVIGLVSGALTRIETSTSLGWAIPIDYALDSKLPQRSVRPAEMIWSGLKLIADREVYLRAFGGPQLPLVEGMGCDQSIAAVDPAWDSSLVAMTELSGYLRSARVAVDLGARQESSRDKANGLMRGQLDFLKERYQAIRSALFSYNQKMSIALARCNRDVASVVQAIERLPDTPSNRSLKVGMQELGRNVTSRVNAQLNEISRQTEYELQKTWTELLQVEPLSDKGSSFLSRPSRSIESDVLEFLGYVGAMEHFVGRMLVLYGDAYPQARSILQSYTLWIESANRQPWDRT